ncbi:interleukin 12Ba isoform X3 [Xiphias gladius]|uniref:interleukin 12Ba isoform X3 n=1 Tax=Xiphias gladius TaxID=8245 RepID=UPI001A994310|nr:interleukin 12Ba isoform X3 [Xiphias gladius]
MKLLVCSIIMCAFLQVSCQNPRSYWTLLPNILVVEVDGSLGEQPLSCFGSPEEVIRRNNNSQDIFWKKNGVEEAQRGNSYLVPLEESLGGGNYTCHSKDGSLVNHTIVLIQEDKTKKRILVKTDQEDYLRCSAQNYNGEFHCSWTWHRSRVGKVAFIKARRVSDNSDIQCSPDSSHQHWTCSSGQSSFSCSVDESGHGITCLDERHCPYAEESKKIDFTVYVRSEHFLVENYSKHFYLSEIVKPDKIAQLKRGWKRCDNPCAHPKATKTWTVQSTDICQFEVKRKAKAVCVRARDALGYSQWSDWSHFRLRRDKKNKKNKH